MRWLAQKKNQIITMTMALRSSSTVFLFLFVCVLWRSNGFLTTPCRPSAWTWSFHGSPENAADDILSQLAGGIDLQMRDNSQTRMTKEELLLQQAGTYDKKAVRSAIDDLVEQNPVAMLTFTECPYCIKARALLDKLGCQYKELNLDTVGRDSYAYRAELYHMTGRTSVPAVWIGGEFVGGCNDGPMGGLMTLNDSGQLLGLLEQAGAL